MGLSEVEGTLRASTLGGYGYPYKLKILDTFISRKYVLLFIKQSSLSAFKMYYVDDGK